MESGGIFVLLSNKFLIPTKVYMLLVGLASLQILLYDSTSSNRLNDVDDNDFRDYSSLLP